MPGRESPLLLLTGAALGDGAHHVVPVDVFDDQTDVPVVHQQPVTRSGVLGELLVGGGHPVVGAIAVVDGDADGFAVRPIGRPGGEPAEADLGALQIGEDADRPSGHVRCCAHPLVVGLVVGVFTVAEVEPGDIHSGLYQCPDDVVFTRRRAQGADDLSASSHDFSA